ncbi:hypothetical protein SmJEL517_g01521 [Synchytrium microbalum]|uniref:Phosphoserine phosphatase n=1 Tax=Synchytrium microbalum TaxID=1806994 RepID=A0A507C495_9FUNG|nr:uncharacterized protein SmJEL517_g01521 [Synchytrium microbalum]TPX36360.1 hypothetical protein SmJEL517_g01521 [Synchytrium microbalum]
MVRVIVFSDFDGTISLQDTGTILIDHCMGKENRRKLDFCVIDGSLKGAEVLKIMWENVNLTYAEAMDMLKDIKMDEDFSTFVQFCQRHSVPVTVLSAGLDTLVKQFLKKELGSNIDAISVIANGLKLTDRRWEIVFHDDSQYGHDKGKSIRKAKATYGRHEPVTNFISPATVLKPESDLTTLPLPLVIFVGDGVSDISAAREADILFAKRGLDLEDWCLKEGVTYTAFDRFSEVLDVVRAVVHNVENNLKL